MTTRPLTLELDEETLRLLEVLGEPALLLAELASAAVDPLRRPGEAPREQTDLSLKDERTKTDVGLEERRKAFEGEADDLLRVARERADAVLRAARKRADAQDVAHSPEATTAGERAQADRALASERSVADAGLVRERMQHSDERKGFLSAERHATDRDLSGERSWADTVSVQRQEANENLVAATIRAHELADEAEAAREHAEVNERELRQVAEFRELFIGILGHDLRNPLAAINMAAAAMLMHGRLDERDSKRAGQIIRSGQRMNGMITQLLDLTRARLGGGMTIEAKPADLGEIAHNVVEEFAGRVELEVQGDVSGIWDPDRLAEVLSNLAGNAIEYATPGTQPRVRAYRDGAEVVVEVSNQGPPIPPDVLPFIFEPFRRASQRKKSASGNLGLGLYIAQQCVVAHGGTLTAQSAGGTTTFVIRLPRPPGTAGERVD